MVFPYGQDPYHLIRTYDTVPDDVHEVDDTHDGAAWDHDAGQAVLDAEEDVNWQLDATAVMHDADADDMPPVTAPTPAELDGMGALAVADYDARASRLWDRLRVSQEALPYAFSLKESRDYQLCALDYHTVQAQYGTAIATFKKALGKARHDSDCYGDHQRSWHFGSVAMPDGTLQPISRHIWVREHNGELTDWLHKGAISVKTHHISDFKGSGKHVLTYHDGLAPGEDSIWAKDLYIPPFEDMVEAVLQPVRLRAYIEAALPWLDEFMATPRSRLEVYGDGHHGVGRMPYDMRTLLHMESNDAADVALQMGFIFNPARRDDISQMLSAPLPEIMEDIRTYGATERFEWVLKHAEVIQANMLDAEYSAVDSRWYPAFTERLQAVQSHIDRLAVLAEELRHMPSSKNSPEPL